MLRLESHSHTTTHLLLRAQGDGGLQMTAQELGSFVRFGSTAVLLLINNNGYLVERYLSPIAHSCECGVLPYGPTVVLAACSVLC